MTGRVAKNDQGPLVPVIMQQTRPGRF